jgi:L-alanine-DL-glutamate epimerase-like enolase superfamily enzyme
VLPYAIAGIDLAMWDLRGKATGLPVHKLLGGQWRDDVRAYGSFGVDAGRKMTADQAAKNAAKFVERGMTAVKLRMQLRERDVDPDPDPTFAYAKAVRQAIGDGVELIIDINGGYTPARAIQMGKRLAGELGVRYFEEPVSSMTPGALRQVVEGLDMYIISGEKEYTRWQQRDVMDLAGVDLLNPDVIKCGGLTEAKKIAALAQATSRRIVPHNTRPTLGTAATLHFAASISNLGPFMEFPDIDDFASLLAVVPQGAVLREGKLVVPTTPGLGVQVDRARVLKAVVA